MGAVLVARHDHPRDRVVERVLTDLVRLVVGAVEALENHLADARGTPNQIGVPTMRVSAATIF